MAWKYQKRGLNLRKRLKETTGRVLGRVVLEVGTIRQLKCPGKEEENPMHFRIGFDAEKLLNSFGLFRSKEYDWLWIKKERDE